MYSRTLTTLAGPCYQIWPRLFVYVRSLTVSSPCCPLPFVYYTNDSYLASLTNVRFEPHLDLYVLACTSVLSGAPLLSYLFQAYNHCSRLFLFQLPIHRYHINSHATDFVSSLSRPPSRYYFGCGLYLHVLFITYNLSQADSVIGSSSQTPVLSIS
jgi:hypothetical protein